MNIGFTGTRLGMSPLQKSTIESLLQDNYVPGSEFHHGDAIGADFQAAEIATKLGYTTIAYPGYSSTDPENDRYRAYHKSDKIKPLEPFIVRDHKIVDAVDMMLATPVTKAEQLRSGTWATIRYAKKTSKPITIINPES